MDAAALESNYYDGIRVLLHVTTSSGVEVQLADVGLFDWVAKVTSNRRIRFVAAGLGIQLVPQLFGAG